MIAITVSSCNKNEDKVSPELSAKNHERLKFDDRDAFDNAIESNRQKAMRTSTTSSTDVDDFFTSFLSPEGIIQIGDKIFKIDTVNQKVLVLDASHDNELKSLIDGDTTNPNIMIFSTLWRKRLACASLSAKRLALVS